MFKLTELYFCQQDEDQNLSVAPRDESLIFLARLRDRLPCRQCSKTWLGLGLRSWAIESMLGYFRIPLEVKAPQDSENESTAQPCTLLFLPRHRSCSCLL